MAPRIQSTTRIRAIPTRYKGILFASKLEADEARVFDQHGIAWAYEVDGYDIDGEWYRPDFWLPRFRTFVETKGCLDEDSDRKVKALARAVACNHILVVLAEPPAGRTWSIVTPEGAYLRQPDGFSRCNSCGPQFFDLDGCRTCPREPERPRHDPPYTREEWIQTWRWWAWLCVKDGRMDDATVFVEEAVRLQEMG